MSKKPTAFFIIDGPKLEMQAHFLVHSILRHMMGRCHFIAYKRADARFPDRLMRLMGKAQIEIRIIAGLVPDPWKRPYGAGNKLLAAADNRGDGISVLLDTDMVFVRPVDFVRELGNAVVGAVLSDYTSNFAKGSIDWQRLYDFMQVEMPSLRPGTLRRPNADYPPYFNGGMVIFRDVVTGDPRRVGEEWLRMGLEMDHGFGLTAGRNNIDQITLSALGARFGKPTAMLRQELNYNIMGWGAPAAGMEPILIHYHALGRLWRVPSIGLPILEAMREELDPEEFKAFAKRHLTTLYLNKAAKVAAAVAASRDKAA